MRHAVNPSKRDYGGLLYGWQDTAVQYTIANWVWWCSVIAVLCLLAAPGYIWWYTELWEVRQECFVRAAAVLIGQRNTAYQSARFAINKHNALVERYDRLFVKVNEAERSQQVAGRRIENGIGARPAVKRGRMVNRTIGDPAGQLHERHEASDFDTKTEDKVAAR